MVFRTLLLKLVTAARVAENPQYPCMSERVVNVKYFSR